LSFNIKAALTLISCSENCSAAQAGKTNVFDKKCQKVGSTNHECIHITVLFILPQQTLNN